MKLTSMRCPSCGAEIQIPEGKPFFFCTFCGTQIHVDDGKITVEMTGKVIVEHRHVNVAKLRELELQEQERKRREKASENYEWCFPPNYEEAKKKEETAKYKWLADCAIWLGGMTILIMIAVSEGKVGLLGYFNFIAPFAPIIGVLLIVFIFLPIVLAAKMPRCFFKSGNVPGEGKRMACGALIGFGIIVLLFLLATAIFR